MHETELYSIILRHLCCTGFGAWLKSMGWNQIEADEITGKLEKRETTVLVILAQCNQVRNIYGHPSAHDTHASYALEL